MSRDPSAEKIGPRTSEVLAGLGTQGLTRSKPNERIRLESVAQCTQAVVQSMPRNQSAAIEHLRVHFGLTPLAVTPELQLSDRVELAKPP